MGCFYSIKYQEGLLSLLCLSVMKFMEPFDKVMRGKAAHMSKFCISLWGTISYTRNRRKYTFILTISHSKPTFSNFTIFMWFPRSQFSTVPMPKKAIGGPWDRLHVPQQRRWPDAVAAVSRYGFLVGQHGIPVVCNIRVREHPWKTLDNYGNYGWNFWDLKTMVSFSHFQEQMPMPCFPLGPWPFLARLEVHQRRGLRREGPGWKLLRGRRGVQRGEVPAGWRREGLEGLRGWEPWKPWTGSLGPGGFGVCLNK